MSYGFTCGYCETTLDTPHKDGDEASWFAQHKGWRMTYGMSRRWGDGAHNTCPQCAENDATAAPIGWEPEVKKPTRRKV